MNNWITSVQKELDLDVVLDVDAILDLARDAAHKVERKMAPVTTYLVGIAVAQGMDFETAVKKCSDLATSWNQENK